MVPRVPMKIAVVQFNPKIGQVQANIAKARDICAKLNPLSVDLVCLPEMIFTGYVFPTSASISPHLENPRTGPTSLFCAELASRLRCYVTAGYPERLQSHEVEGSTDKNNSVVERIGANSAVLYGPTGEWVGGYRKTNLFDTDKSWAKPGTGFTTFSLPSPLNAVSLGICMDLNTQPPAHWKLETGPYELADYCLLKKTKLLILLNAWIDSGTDMEHKHDGHTLNFWATRLRPLWAKSQSRDDSPDDLDPKHRDETAVVICNRSGEENGITFAGTSAALCMRRESGSPKLLGKMGRDEEGVQVWTI